MYSVSLTDEQVHSLCRSAVYRSDRISKVLGLVKVDPALSPAFSSCLTALSAEVITLALEKLERKEYSHCAAVARLVRVFEKVERSDSGAREGLAAALDPLWRFIEHRSRTSSLVEAFFVAQTLKSSDSAPTASTMDLLQAMVKKNSRLVKLALPTLRRWPFLASMDFSTKVEFLRGSFEASPQFSELGIRISRSNILRDSYVKFSQLSSEKLRLSGSLKVEFEGEAGSDGGGRIETGMVPGFISGYRNGVFYCGRVQALFTTSPTSTLLAAW